ncbi:porphobilinogen synthase [Venenivibrio stagnispumantis]|uniref:Delta-aminolevulinic acid dehydratase n=1 Tax=Venenivibrio stagnispumantis TaxID=407998 RepID=A0AA46AFQ3_9AQUI|nr:porphobilinogen synthase [Venenivibrio stagnispumantis]MCW4573391.1 porphobilinogen synthase [Venenivibrio stagnispumantis]SMP20701.1 porphobilinogen synthase [Venenivibrio stagnispumantis]
MAFPTNRLRRLRKNENIRRLVRETHLSVDNLIYPIFVEDGVNIIKEIPSMPGIFRYSIDNLSKELDEVVELNIPAILLFGIPSHKDEIGSDTFNDEGIIQRAIRYIKQNYPQLYVITDVCFCEYTSHGHCGVLHNHDVDNDATLENTKKQVISHAKAGADMVAPSGMMDGVVKAIREALDSAGYYDIPIMSYSAKYASSYYGPFREAADSTPAFGDRRTYQMDIGNRLEALREVALDIEEGADIVMVKPALAYLDIIREIKDSFNIPLAAYNVSGEYSMIKAAGKLGWIDEKKVMLETITAIKRAGADIIITYFAKEIAKMIK